MKPFDIELAKQGHPVCTRDGRDARIICWDCSGTDPIVALVRHREDDEIGLYYKNDGSSHDYENDLFMKETKEKRWIALLFRYMNGNLFSESVGSFVFKSREDANKCVREEYPQYYQSDPAKNEIKSYQVIEIEIEV